MVLKGEMKYRKVLLLLKVISRGHVQLHLNTIQ